MPTPTAWTTEAAAILRREQKMSSKTSDDDRTPATAAGRRYALHPPGSLAEWEDAIREIEAEAATRPDARVERLEAAIRLVLMHHHENEAAISECSESCRAARKVIGG